jgi:hypothetical protein
MGCLQGAATAARAFVLVFANALCFLLLMERRLPLRHRSLVPAYTSQLNIKAGHYKPEYTCHPQANSDRPMRADIVVGIAAVSFVALLLAISGKGGGKISLENNSGTGGKPASGKVTAQSILEKYDFVAISGANVPTFHHQDQMIDQYYTTGRSGTWDSLNIDGVFLLRPNGHNGSDDGRLEFPRGDTTEGDEWNNQICDRWNRSHTYEGPCYLTKTLSAETLGILQTGAGQPFFHDYSNNLSFQYGKESELSLKFKFEDGSQVVDPTKGVNLKYSNYFEGNEEYKEHNEDTGFSSQKPENFYNRYGKVVRYFDLDMGDNGDMQNTDKYSEVPYDKTSLAQIVKMRGERGGATNSLKFDAPYYALEFNPSAQCYTLIEETPDPADLNIYAYTPCINPVRALHFSLLPFNDTHLDMSVTSTIASRKVIDNSATLDVSTVYNYSLEFESLIEVVRDGKEVNFMSSTPSGVFISNRDVKGTVHEFCGNPGNSEFDIEQDYVVYCSGGDHTFEHCYENMRKKATANCEKTRSEPFEMAPQELEKCIENALQNVETAWKQRCWAGLSSIPEKQNFNIKFGKFDHGNCGGLGQVAYNCPVNPRDDLKPRSCGCASPPDTTKAEPSAAKTLLSIAATTAMALL